MAAAIIPSLVRRHSNRRLLEKLSWRTISPEALRKWLTSIEQSCVVDAGGDPLRAIVASFWCAGEKNWRGVFALCRERVARSAAAKAAAAPAVAPASDPDLATATPIDLFHKSVQLLLRLDSATAIDVCDWYFEQPEVSRVEDGWNLESLKHVCQFYYDERKYTLEILAILFEIDAQPEHVYYDVVHPLVGGAVLSRWSSIVTQTQPQPGAPTEPGAECFVRDLLQMSAAGLSGAHALAGEDAFAAFWHKTALNDRSAGQGRGFLPTAKRMRTRASTEEPRIAADVLMWFLHSTSVDEIAPGKYCSVIVALLHEIYGDVHNAGVVRRLRQEFPPEESSVAVSALNLVALRSLRLDTLAWLASVDVDDDPREVQVRYGDHPILALSGGGGLGGPAGVGAARSGSRETKLVEDLHATVKGLELDGSAAPIIFAWGIFVLTVTTCKVTEENKCALFLNLAPTEGAAQNVSAKMSDLFERNRQYVKDCLAQLHTLLTSDLEKAWVYTLIRPKTLFDKLQQSTNNFQNSRNPITRGYLTEENIRILMKTGMRELRQLVQDTLKEGRDAWFEEVRFDQQELSVHQLIEKRIERAFTHAAVQARRNLQPDGFWSAYFVGKALLKQDQILTQARHRFNNQHGVSYDELQETLCHLLCNPNEDVGMAAGRFLKSESVSTIGDAANAEDLGSMVPVYRGVVFSLITAVIRVFPMYYCVWDKLLMLAVKDDQMRCVQILDTPREESAEYQADEILKKLSGDAMLHLGGLSDASMAELRLDSTQAAAAAQSAIDCNWMLITDGGWLPAAIDVYFEDNGEFHRLMSTALFEETDPPEVSDDGLEVVWVSLPGNGANPRRAFVLPGGRHPGTRVEVLMRSGEDEIYEKAHTQWDGSELSVKLEDPRDNVEIVEPARIRRETSSVPHYLALLSALASSHESAYHVIHRLKSATCGGERWNPGEDVLAPEMGSLTSMWSLLGLWIQQADTVLASAQSTVAPQLPMNNFIETAAAAVQLVTRLLQFAIDPAPMAAAAKPRRFEVRVVEDDMETEYDLKMSDYHIQQLGGAAEISDFVGLAYVQPLSTKDEPNTKNVFYIREKLDEHEWVEGRIDSLNHDGTMDIKFGDGELGRSLAPEHVNRTGGGFGMHQIGDDVKAVKGTKWWLFSVFGDEEINDAYREYDVLTKEFQMNHEELSRYRWGKEIRWAAHIRERMFDGLFWHVDHQCTNAARNEFKELRGRSLSLEKLVAVLSNLFSHCAVSIAKIGAFDTDEEDRSLAEAANKEGLRFEQSKVQRGQRVICAARLHQIAGNCVCALQRLSMIRPEWVLNAMVKKVDGDEHLFIRSVKRILERRERVRGHYPVVLAAIKLLHCVARRSANVSSSLTISAVFQEFDENGDKQVSKEEFKMGLLRLGFRLPDKVVQQLVSVLDADHSGTIDYEEFVKYAAGGAQLSALAAKGVDRQVVSFFEQIGRSQNQAKEQLDELLAAIVDFSTETLRDHAVWRYTDSTHTQRWSLGAACIKLLSSVLRRASLAATSSSEELDELGDHPAALDLLNKLLHNLPIGSAVLSCATRLADEYIATCAADFHRGIFSVLRKKLKSSDPGVAVVVSEEQPALFEHPDFRRGRDSVSKFEEAALEDLAGAAFTLLHHTLTACGVEWLASDKVALFTRGRVVDAQRRSDSSAAKIGGGSRLHSATSAYPAAQHPIAAIVAFASYPVVVEGGPNLPQHAALLITELSRCMHAAQANSFASPLRSAASMAIRQALALAEHEVQAHVKMHVIEGTVERELPSVQDALRRIRPPSLFSFIGGLHGKDIASLVQKFTEVCTAKRNLGNSGTEHSIAVLQMITTAIAAQPSFAAQFLKPIANEAALEASGSKASSVVGDDLPPLLAYMREKIIPNAGDKFEDNPRLLAAYLALLRELWEAAGRGISGQFAGQGGARLAAASHVFDRVVKLLLMDASPSAATQNFWKPLADLVNMPSFSIAAEGTDEDDESTNRSYRCLCKALVLQMMSITLIRMPQSFLAGEPVLLQGKLEFAPLFARAKQREVLPCDLKRDLKAPKDYPWVLFGNHRGATPYTAEDMDIICIKYEHFYNKCEKRRVAFFKRAVNPTFTVLDQEIKSWTAAVRDVDHMCSFTVSDENAVCLYDPDVAQLAHEKIAGLGMPLANFRLGQNSPDASIDLEECSAVPGMENISSGGEGEGGENAIFPRFFFNYGKGFAFDEERLKMCINASMAAITARLIAADEDDDPPAADLENYWPDSRSNRSQHVRREALRDVRNYELVLSRTHARMLLIDATRTFLSVYTGRVISRAQAPLDLPQNMQGNTGLGQLNSIARTLSGLLSCEDGRLGIFKKPYLQGGAHPPPSAGGAQAGAGQLAPLSAKIVISPPLLETLHDLVGLYASTLRSTIRAHRDRGKDLNIDAKQHLIRVKKWSTNVISLRVEIKPVTPTLFNRFDLLKRAPDFLPMVISMLSTLLAQLQIEQAGSERDQENSLVGLQLFFLRSAAESFALLQPGVLKSLKLCRSTMAATSHARADAPSAESTRRSAHVYEAAVKQCLEAQHPLVAVLAFMVSVVRSLQKNCRSSAELTQAASNFRSHQTVKLVTELLHFSSALVACEVSPDSTSAFGENASGGGMARGKSAMIVVKLCSSFLVALATQPDISIATGRGGDLHVLQVAREERRLRQQSKEKQKIEFKKFTDAVDSKSLKPSPAVAAKVKEFEQGFAPHWWLRKDKELTYWEHDDLIKLINGQQKYDIEWPFEVIIAGLSLEDPPTSGWIEVTSSQHTSRVEAVRNDALKRAYAAHLQRLSAEKFERESRSSNEQGLFKMQQGTASLAQPLRELLYEDEKLDQENVVRLLVGNELLQWYSKPVHDLKTESAQASASSAAARRIGLFASAATKDPASSSGTHGDELPPALRKDLEWFWSRVLSLTSLMLRNPSSKMECSKQLFEALNFARIFKVQLLKPMTKFAAYPKDAQRTSQFLISSPSRRPIVPKRAAALVQKTNFELTLHSLEILLGLAEQWQQWKVVDSELFNDLESALFGLVVRCSKMLDRDDADPSAASASANPRELHSAISGRDEVAVCQVLLCALRILRIMAPVPDPHWQSLMGKVITSGEGKPLFESPASKRARRDPSQGSRAYEDSTRKIAQETAQRAMDVLKDQSIRPHPVFAEDGSALHRREPERPRIKVIKPCVHRAIETIVRVSEGDSCMGTLEPHEMLHSLNDKSLVANKFRSELCRPSNRTGPPQFTSSASSMSSMSSSSSCAVHMPELPRQEVSCDLSMMRARMTEVSGHCRVAFRLPKDGSFVSQLKRRKYAERLEDCVRRVLAASIAQITKSRTHLVEVITRKVGGVHMTAEHWVVEHDWHIYFTARLVRQLGEVSILISTNSMFWSSARGPKRKTQWSSEIGIGKSDSDKLDKPIRKAALHRLDSKTAPDAGAGLPFLNASDSDVWYAHPKGKPSSLKFHLSLEDNEPSAALPAVSAQIAPSDMSNAYWEELRSSDTGPGGRMGATMTNTSKAAEKTQRLFLAGGQSAQSSAVSASDFLWELTVKNDGDDPKWTQPTLVGQGGPDLRWGHAAVWWSDGNDTSTPCGKVWLIGGRSTGPGALPSQGAAIERGRIIRPIGADGLPTSTEVSWSTIGLTEVFTRTSGLATPRPSPAPLARYGHSAILVSNKHGHVAIFGGKDQNDKWCSNDIFVLSLREFTYCKVYVRPESFLPCKRLWHSAVPWRPHVEDDSDDVKRSMLVFGGDLGVDDAEQHEDQWNQLWKFDFNDDEEEGPEKIDYQWTQVTTFSAMGEETDAHRSGGVAVAWVRPGGHSELVTCWGKRTVLRRQGGYVEERSVGSHDWAVKAHDVERDAARRWREHEVGPTVKDKLKERGFEKAAAAFVGDKLIAFGGKQLGPPPNATGDQLCPPSLWQLRLGTSHRYNVKYWVPFISVSDLTCTGHTTPPPAPFASKGLVKVYHAGGTTTKLVNFRPPILIDSIGRTGVIDRMSALNVHDLGRWCDLGTFSFVVVHGRKGDDDANKRVEVEAEGSDGIVLASRVLFTDALGCMKQCRERIEQMMSHTVTAAGDAGGEVVDFGCSAAIAQ